MGDIPMQSVVVRDSYHLRPEGRLDATRRSLLLTTTLSPISYLRRALVYNDHLYMAIVRVFELRYLKPHQDLQG